MKVLVYAAGAVGLGIASCLIKAGAKVDIVARKETVYALRDKGLIRTGIFGEFKANPNSFGAWESADKLPSKEYDFILVCCKSFDTLKSAQDLSNHFSHKEIPIVLFQNGWGNAEIFTRFFKKHLIYNARVITGFERKEPNVVNITVHADDIRIGSIFNSDLSCIKPLCDYIKDGGIPCSISPHIEKDLWAKMLYNCLLNPLSAILKVSYGSLAENENTREIMNNIAKEIFEVMKRAGYSTYWDTVEEYLDVFYKKLIPPTSAHRSSTLQDIARGKKTEIDSLTGQIIRLAEKQGIDVPYNRSVYRMVKFLEN